MIVALPLLLFATILSVVHGRFAPPPTFSPLVKTTAPPSTVPSAVPTLIPSSKSTTISPSVKPTATVTPTAKTTASPSTVPSVVPTLRPSAQPSTISPSVKPTTTVAPTAKTTVSPSIVPSVVPTLIPSSQPSTISPSAKPTTTVAPTAKTTVSPSTLPSAVPTLIPSSKPSTISPSLKPTATVTPTAKTTASPSTVPSTVPTLIPSSQPSTISPSVKPTTTVAPTAKTTVSPSIVPSVVPTLIPSSKPSTVSPSAKPTFEPTAKTTVSPSTVSSTVPTLIPSSKPTTFSPSVKPTTVAPTAKTTSSPSTVPTTAPSFIPSSKPITVFPTVKSTAAPSAKATSSPSTVPTTAPSLIPSAKPTTASPSAKPSTAFPSKTTSTKPSSFNPSIAPTAAPSYKTTANPSTLPSTTPSINPSSISSKFLVHATAPEGYTTQDGVTTSNGKLFSSMASTNLAFDIAYYGGAFMAGQVNLYNIYYGSSNSQSLIDYLAANIGNSPWYTTMKHYSGGGKTISGPVTFSTTNSKVVTSYQSTITDAFVQSVITGFFKAGTLTADQNGIYTFIFRGDIAFSGWLTQWCGFHSTLTYNGKSYKYFVAGDSSFSTSGASCQGYRSGTTANNNIGADSVASVYAHELVETVSDFSGLAFYASVPGGGLQENADLCAWNWGTLLPGSANANVVIGSKNFLIQQNWLPGVGCVLNDGSITTAPTESPTVATTIAPTESPTMAPSFSPSPEPTISMNPTYTYTESPTDSPNFAPSEIPTFTQTSGAPVTAAPSESPTLSPLSPTEFPTESPTASPFVELSPSAVPTYSFNTLHVPFYSAINTYSARRRTVPYNFTACPGITLKISDCDPSRCFSGRRSSDQYIRLVDSTHTEVASNDDSCSSCSTIIYTTQGSCQQYTLQQGCYMNRFCTGNFTIQAIAQPTSRPTPAPIISPTEEPTISLAPISSNELTCPFSTRVISNWWDLLNNGVTCGPFQFCPGMQITIQDTSPRCGYYEQQGQGNRWRKFSEIIAVYDTNNNPISESYIQYSSYSSSAPCQSATISTYSSWGGGENGIQQQPCQQYTLYMGCGSSSCSLNGGQYTITTTITPTAAPTVRAPHHRGGGGGGGEDH